MFMGPAVLREVIENAELYPIKGLFNFRDYFDEIDAYYHETLGNELGISTGWKALDDLYNVVPGELTLVTGVPNSGKSEWIDALVCNLNENVGWKFALCSMENKYKRQKKKKGIPKGAVDDNSAPKAKGSGGKAKNIVVAYEVLDKFSGSSLVGKKYVPLFEPRKEIYLKRYSSVNISFLSSPCEARAQSSFENLDANSIAVSYDWLSSGEI
ncbi:hypothetical protein L2E82_13225 [Cichorium intybus]|uniref:Uncharacterized protein n=1 Tax=Cichorium intybus TaxID=13427 RepID=A0ACB9GJI6_CICIN|nr:hypothetical protein L2E82_13225 [Cichorium intybus]